MAKLAFIEETDPWSGKVSSAAARRTIRSHVMRTYMMNKENLNNVNAKHFVVQPSKPNGQPNVVVSTEHIRSTAWSNACAATRRAIDNSTRPVNSSPSVQEMARNRLESPSRLLNRATDAFVYAGSSIDVKSYGFFSHYASEFHFILCEDVQPLPIIEQTLCCSAAVQENCTALLYAICFTAATHDLAIRCQGQSPLESLPSSVTLASPYQAALRYKAHSLQLLTKLLTQPNVIITETLILCVSILLVSAAVYGDCVALKAHFNGLRSMLRLLGGEQNLSPRGTNHVQLATLKGCLVLQVPPLLRLKPYVQKRFDILSGEDVQVSESASGVPPGSGFACFSLLLRLKPVIRKTLRYMTQLILRIEQTKNKQTLSCAVDVEDFIALEHVLISMPYETPLGELDECVRLALLLYFNIAIWKTPLWFPWVTCLVNNLEIALISLGSQKNLAEVPSELMLWMLLMGRYAASMMSNGKLMWWSNRLTYLASDMLIRSWPEARQILEQFFYAEEVCGQSWRLTWEALVALDCKRSRTGQPIPRHPCNYHP